MRNRGRNKGVTNGLFVTTRKGVRSEYIPRYSRKW